MEAGTRSRYEFTTLRIVLLVIGVVLWFLLAFGAATRESDGEAVAGYLLGSLLLTLAVSWVIRTGFRFAWRRPVLEPAWTPGLFWGAALIQLLSAIGNAAPD
jgi:hypothetical protein